MKAIEFTEAELAGLDWALSVASEVARREKLPPDHLRTAAGDAWAKIMRAAAELEEAER